MFSNKVFFSACLVAVTCLSYPVYAGSYFSMAKDSVGFPSEMLVNQQGLGYYTVGNISGASRTVYMRNLPSGFSVVPAMVEAPETACPTTQSFSLDNNASCTIGIAYSSNVLTSFNDYLPTVCPTAQSSIGCVAPANTTSFSVVDSSSSMLTLSAASHVLMLSPGETSQWVVTNGTSQIANNVQLALPASLQTYLDTGAVTQCSSIAAGGECTFILPMKSTLPEWVDEEPITIQGSNTQPLILDSSVESTLLDVPLSLTLSLPNTSYALTMTNRSGITYSGLSIAGSEPAGVSVQSNTCQQTLAPQQSCTITYMATEHAYGSSTQTIQMMVANTPRTVTYQLIVQNTTVAIDNGQDVKASISGGNFTITNTGSFDWQAPSVIPADNWLELINNCGSSVAPGASCAVTYSMTSPHDYSSVITASGANIVDTHQDLELSDNVSIGTDEDAGQVHLMARAVKVTNLTISAVILSNIVAPSATDLGEHVVLCDTAQATTPNCLDALSTCYDGLTLSEGDSCYFWYQATNHNHTDPLSTQITYTGNFSLTATSENKAAVSTAASRAITFQYGNKLYVGSWNGYPTSLPDAVDLATWDGTAWSRVGNSVLNEEVNSMTIYKNDLYVGGYFRQVASGISANRIAQFNGSSWSALGSGFNLPVFALTTVGDTLYAGGNFTTAGEQSVNNIAQWNGSSWSALGSGFNSSVNALTTVGNTLYAGGAFTTAGNNIAQWDGSSWSALGTGFNSSVRALTTVGNTLYAGGTFNINTAGGQSANKIAQWNGSSWSALSSGFNSSVYALTTVGNTLYAGGWFTTAGGQSANRVAQWNGSSWSSLPNFNGGDYVKSLNSYPYLVLED